MNVFDESLKHHMYIINIVKSNWNKIQYNTIFHAGSPFPNVGELSL